jgi:hypothetical protein
MAMTLGRPSPTPPRADLQSMLAPRSSSARLKSFLKKTVAVPPMGNGDRLIGFGAAWCLEPEFPRPPADAGTALPALILMC